VPLIDNDVWDPVLQFSVELLEEGLEGGSLGRYLWQAWVEVIDNDAFPSNKYKDEVENNLLHKISKLGLLFEYVKFINNNPVVKSGTLKMVFTDQACNIYGLFNLYLSVYIIDFVVKTTVPEHQLFFIHDRETSLWVLVTIQLLPIALLHYLHYQKPSWKVIGESKRVLQTALLRKFLNYSSDVRLDLQQGDLILAMARDAFDVVDAGYIKLLGVLKSFGGIGIALVFQCTAPFIFNRPFRIWIVGAIILFPVALATFAWLRYQVTSRWLNQTMETQADLATHVNETVQSYRLIADYNRRPFFIERYEKLIDKNNQVTSDTARVICNNGYAAQWFTASVVCLFTLIGGYLVIIGNMTLGMFLANIRILTLVGDASEGMYATMMDIQMVLPQLTRITRLLNLPIDVDERKQLYECSCEATTKRQETFGAVTDSKVLVDSHPLEVHNLEIHFPGSPAMQIQKLLFTGRMTMPQGKLIALVGAHGSGKSTLLKCLGSEVLPAEPEDARGLYLPSHLRALHVASAPMFFSGTLMENLTFGVREGDPDAGIERVRRVCRKLEIPEEVVAFLDTDDVLNWGVIFSSSVKHLLTLARAFIASPEVLLLHKPTLSFNEEKSQFILDILREFVDQRGLEVTEEDYPMKCHRPHTCIFSTSRLAGVRCADLLFKVSPEGLAQIKNDAVTSDMLS